VYVLHVVKPLLLKVKTLVEAQHEVMEEGKELVNRAGQLLRKKGFNVRTAVQPRIFILDFAAKWHPDLNNFPRPWMVSR
jgi:hypothetical protein